MVPEHPGIIPPGRAQIKQLRQICHAATTNNSSMWTHRINSKHIFHLELFTSHIFHLWIRDLLKGILEMVGHDIHHPQANRRASNSILRYTTIHGKFTGVSSSSILPFANKSRTVFLAIAVNQPWLSTNRIRLYHYPLSSTAMIKSAYCWAVLSIIIIKVYIAGGHIMHSQQRE